MVVALGALSVYAVRAFGGSGPSPLFYLIENRETGEVVRRGVVADAGLLRNEVILAPETIYREWLFDPSTGLLGFEDFETPTAGLLFKIPSIQLRLPAAPDSDRDGLTDDVEYVVGTNPDLPDTDGDGVRDGAEIRQGLDPVGGRPVRTGVIGSVDTPGQAQDVAAIEGRVYVADGASGLAVFNAVEGGTLVRLTQLDTPGEALRVAGAGNWVAVADGSAGLAVVDVTVPSQARLVRQVAVGGVARAVTVAAGMAFVGTASGQVLMVDLASGSILSRLDVGSVVHDVALGGDTLFVLAGNSLHSVGYDDGNLTQRGSVAASALVPEGITGAKRLFVADGVAYATSYPGYDTFDVSNPAAMVRLGSAVDGGFNSFKQIVLNGSGLGLAAVGVNPRNDGTHHISLYNVANPAQTAVFLTTLPTPGVARAVAINNGLAYVADSEAGLQVLNYLAFDVGTNAPTISLAANFPLAPAAAEEGKLARVTARVGDDVQVRNVEFYLDGQRVATDGNYPFEHRFVTPLRTAGRTNFTLQARAFDTGGNATWTPLYLVPLVPDATPPRVVGTQPGAGAILGEAAAVTVFFNEPVDGASVGADRLTLRGAGADGVLGTADDSNVVGMVVSALGELKAVRGVLATNLPPGQYEGRVLAGVRDGAGNAMTEPFTWRFWILGGRDRDQDGVPDVLEAELGYLADNPDSDGDGLWDGDEDLDGDGLMNRWELVFQLDPRKADTDGNQRPDGLEDPDLDGLTNLQEQAARTLPGNWDSDGDGWDDATEVADGTNPLNGRSGPRVMVASVEGRFLNAALGARPVGVPVSVSGPAWSYLNAVPENRPASILFSVAGPAFTYLNAVSEMQQGESRWLSLSPIASYLNAVTAAGPMEWAGIGVVGARVSYSNAVQQAESPIVPAEGGGGVKQGRAGP
jgi:hypothetical protein